jgi:hypothetical protein
MRRALGIAMVSLFAAAAPARAELINLGNGMIYDSVQDLTWLQDMGYVRSSGYDADGRLTYSQARTWADSLTFGGYDDWRLPTMTVEGLAHLGEDEITEVMAQLGGRWEASDIGDGLSWWNYDMPSSFGPFIPPTRTAMWVTPPSGSNQCPTWYTGCYSWMGWTTIDLAQYHWGSPETAGPTAWAVRDGMARVPEPSVLALLGVGATLAFGRRRQRREAPPSSTL